MGHKMAMVMFDFVLCCRFCHVATRSLVVAKLSWMPITGHDGSVSSINLRMLTAIYLTCLTSYHGSPIAVVVVVLILTLPILRKYHDSLVIFSLPAHPSLPYRDQLRHLQ